MLLSLISHPLALLVGFVVGAPVGVVFHAVLSTWIAKEKAAAAAEIASLEAKAKSDLGKVGAKI